MEKFKIYFCLFLFLLSIIYLYNKSKTINLYSIFFEKSVKEVVGTISVKKESFDNNYLSNDTFSSKKDKNVTDNKKGNNNFLVYLYNTHEEEKYKTKDGFTPSVITCSKIIEKRLTNKGIKTLRETRKINEKLVLYGYDYSGTYSISFDYLKEMKNKYKTINYYFDIHRDSITGKNSKVTIGGKKYATMMFLVGQNNKDYKKNVENIKVMEKYLNQNYKGLLRDTYYQPKYAYNQGYSPRMFLVEIGGPENTLQEITNTSIALSNAIYSYVSAYEK